MIFLVYDPPVDTNQTFCLIQKLLQNLHNPAEYFWNVLKTNISKRYDSKALQQGTGDNLRITWTFEDIYDIYEIYCTSWVIQFEILNYLAHCIEVLHVQSIKHTL